MRDVAMRLAEDRLARGDAIVIGSDDLLPILGPPKHRPELMGRSPTRGVVTGLGWTPAGGRLLFVEATTTAGEGRLRLTGSLGSVMKESGQAALTLVRAGAKRFGIAEDFMRDKDVHVHLPAGGVPKDGPSAGIAVTVALVSALTGRVVRHDVAMTGEVTLRGHVLPVGGIREKVLAAHRAGIRDVVLPEGNRKDEPDIPVSARADLRLHFVSRIDDVLTLVLLDAA
jgi:ATP-dependent Lon protease